VEADCLLNKFYIVPYEFRQYFPLRFKIRSSHDIVLLCVECRQEMSIVYNAVRKGVYKQAFGPKWQPLLTNSQKFNVCHKIVKARKSARALLKCKLNIPAKRRAELENDVFQVLPTKIEEITSDVLKEVMDMNSKVENADYVCAAKILVSDLLEGKWDISRSKDCNHDNNCTCYLCSGDPSMEGDVEHFRLKGFIRTWRFSFVSELEDTKYLPEGWSLYHKIQDYEKS